MRIRIWNAFASNNSGSYVIVGRFPSVELAKQVADELLEVAKEQSTWVSAPTGPSPLRTYAAKHGIVHSENDRGDDWPEYSQAAHPAVWSIEHQVFVHSDYTVTMPREIGHLIYARGGRVDIELNHAHEAIVALFEIYFPWKTRAQVDVPARVQDIVDALCAERGVFATLNLNGIVPAWRGTLPEAEPKFGEPDLVIGAAFEDLCAGFTGIATACSAAGAQVNVRLSERHADVDPFAFLRPSAPAATAR